MSGDSCILNNTLLSLFIWKYDSGFVFMPNNVLVLRGFMFMYKEVKNHNIRLSATSFQIFQQSNCVLKR